MFLLSLNLDLYAPGGPEFLREAAKACRIKSKTKVLEVGCSSGFGSRYLAKKYHCRVTATDINPAWLPLIKPDRRMKIQAEDVLKLSFPKESFEVAFANGVLYLTDKAGALREVNRVLKKGGFFALGDPVFLKTSVPYSLRRVLEVGGAEVVTAEKYEKLFAENGFAVRLKKIYPSLLWENYYSPLQARLSEWRQQNSPNLTKYAVEIDFILEEMDNVRRFGPKALGYLLLVGQKVAPATLELLPGE